MRHTTRDILLQLIRAERDKEAVAILLLEEATRILDELNGGKQCEKGCICDVCRAHAGEQGDSQSSD